MKHRTAPGFFGLTVAGVGAAGNILGGLGSAAGGLFGGNKQTLLDDSAVRQQLQEREIAARQAEQAAARTQRAGETGAQADRDATRQRVEALDRIIGIFRQNLRIK